MMGYFNPIQLAAPRTRRRDAAPYADRIKARAIRRRGQLLKQIEPAQGANQNIHDGDDRKVTQTSAATEAALPLLHFSRTLRKSGLLLLPAPDRKEFWSSEHGRAAAALAKVSLVVAIALRHDDFAPIRSSADWANELHARNDNSARAPTSIQQSAVQQAG